MEIALEFQFQCSVVAAISDGFEIYMTWFNNQFRAKQIVLVHSVFKTPAFTIIIISIILIIIVICIIILSN